MNDVEQLALPLALLLMLVGIAAQFVARMATLEEHGTVPTPIEYVRKHPWRCLNLFIGSVMLLLWLRNMGQLNEFSAIATGYLCQDAADRWRMRAEKAVGP